MRATLSSELAVLAADCNVELAKREAQVESWLNRWGTEDDEAIRSAFRYLRQPGIMRGSWPSFGEMASAIEYGRATVRRRETVIPAGGDRESRPIGPRRLTACVVFATLHRGAPRADIEAAIDQILSPSWSDADIDAFLADNRQVLARRPVLTQGDSFDESRATLGIGDETEARARG